MLLIGVSVAKQHEHKSNQKRLWLEIGGDWRSWHVAVDPSCAGFPTDLLPRKYMGWQCRRSRSREESNPLSFQLSLRHCHCMLEFHVGASRWAQIGLKSAWPVSVTYEVRVCSPYPKFGPSISLRPFYTQLTGCGAHCERAFVHYAKEILGFWPTYWMLSRWQRDHALTCSLGSICQEGYGPGSVRAW